MNMKSSLLIAAFSFSAVAMAITPNASGVYEIGNASQLEEFAAVVNGGNVTANAMLTADIDMTKVTHTVIGNSKANAYKGIFDGQFHTIDNLVMDLSTGTNFALFGYVGVGAKICNTVMGDFCEFNGEDKCAAFVAQASDSQEGFAEFICLGSAATVHAYSTDSSKGRAAGIAGPSDGNVAYKFINCYNTGEVRGVTVGGMSCNAPKALCQGCFSVTNVKKQQTADVSAKNPSPVGAVFIAGLETFVDGWTYNFFFGGSANKGSFYPNIYESAQSWNKASWIEPHASGQNGVYKVFQDDWAETGALCYFLNNKSTENAVWGQNLDEGDTFPTFVPGKKVVAGDVAAFTFKNTGAVTQKPASPLPDNSGVNEINAADNGADVIYTIQGVRVKEMTTPGMYIVNGKKVMVK